jgi:uncharacterized protein
MSTFSSEFLQKSLIENIDKNLVILCENAGVNPSHGIDHMRAVKNNAVCAAECWKYPLNEITILMIISAAFLHDADDRKLFPLNVNYENARDILNNSQVFTENEINVIIRMIDLVSASKNKDEIPPDVIGKEWMLIPRYADRLEAFGKIGVQRTIEYTTEVGMAFYTPETLRIKNFEELKEKVPRKRYDQYNGVSASMIDHIYDKLIHICEFPIRNPFFDEECEKRKQDMFRMIYAFGNGGEFTEQDFWQFAR